MAKQASVRFILESVSAEVEQSEVLKGILDEPSDDDTKVPEGQERVSVRLSWLLLALHNGSILPTTVLLTVDSSRPSV